MHDVLLVLMPYVAVERPSVALGTLKACLLRAGISVGVEHGNMRFAEAIGLLAYEGINTSALTHRIGEWTFAGAAFPDHDLQPARYLEALSNVLGDPPGLTDQLLAVRAMASAFVDVMAEAVLAHKPRIVGCSSVFQQQCASLALLRRIRELDPTVVTMLGGGNCEGEMGWVAHQSFDWVDFVVSGEADEVIVPLCQAVFEMGRAVPRAQLGPGVFGPVHKRQFGLGPPAEAALYARAQRMDRIPVPIYDDYFDELRRMNYRAHVHPGITIETARGCWWGQKHHCTFCGISDSGMQFRAKGSAQVLAELESLTRAHGIKRFVTADNIIETSYFDSLIPELAENARGFSLFYQTKANLKRHQVEALAKAGVRWIQPGIESLDERVLRLLVKGASGAINVQLLKWARNYGVWVMWNMLFGAPGEKDDWYLEVAEWLPLIYHLQPPAAAQLTTIRYNRFSPYHQKPEQFGLELVPAWAYQYTYPHDQRRRALQAYYFEDVGDVAQSAQPWTRPGIRLVNQRIREWTELFIDSTGPMPVMSPLAPRLVATPHDDRLLIRDTRPCAVAPTHDLSVLETRVYRACDAATTLAGLVSALEQASPAVPASEAAAIVQQLKERKLVLEFGERLLALAVDPPQPYPQALDFPAGLLLERPLRAAAVEPPSLLPWEQPVRTLFQELTG